MTLRGVALALGRRVTTNSEALQLIRDHYREVWKGEVVLTPARRKMAALPEGSTPQHNPVGTAPGVRIEYGRTVIYCLPGVPKEMKAIFKASVEKEIRKKMGKIFTETVIMDLEGIYESTLAPMLRKAGREFPRAYIKSHPKGMKEGRSRIELDIVITHKVKEKALKEIRALKEKLSEEIGEAKGAIVRIKGTA
jgi:molybdopterin-biosynthesis enzyme MoeA-like protein